MTGASNLWEAYAPEATVQILDETAGAWADREIERFITRLYRARRKWTRPAVVSCGCSPPSTWPIQSIMERFGEIRANLRRRGMLIPDFDLLVGVTALHHELTLLTSNVRHMSRIPGLRVYEDRR